MIYIALEKLKVIRRENEYSMKERKNDAPQLIVLQVSHSHYYTRNKNSSTYYFLLEKKKLVTLTQT